MAEIENKFGTKIMTFIDPYKQNDSYTIEIKKNAYFDYEQNMEESSQGFQNKSSYNLKVPKKKTQALVEDVEFRNKPKVDSNKKGFLDSLFGFFKTEEDKPKNPKKKFNPRNRYKKSSTKPRNTKNFKGKQRTSQNKLPKKSVKPNKPKPPVNGNLKSSPANTPVPLPADDIGNRVEPKKKSGVRRAKNDPRAKN